MNKATTTIGDPNSPTLQVEYKHEGCAIVGEATVTVSGPIWKETLTAEGEIPVLIKPPVRIILDLGAGASVSFPRFPFANAPQRNPSCAEDGWAVQGLPRGGQLTKQDDGSWCCHFLIERASGIDGYGATIREAIEDVRLKVRMLGREHDPRD